MPAITKAARKKRRAVYNWRTTAGYFFIAPSVIGLAFIFIPSLVTSIAYSFSEVVIDFNEVVSSRVGWANYYEAFFVNTDFRVLLFNGVKGMALDSVLILIFSFFVATILNQRFIGRSFARMIFFLPVILSTGLVATVQMATTNYNPFVATAAAGARFGGSGGLSSLFNLSDLLYKLSVNETLSTAIVYAVNNTYNIVNASGVQIIIFLSALQSIPTSLFEASKVEGASKWEEFWKITFPIITPMIFVNFVYTVIDSFTNPLYGIMTYIQTQAFGYNRLGFGAALSWIYFLIILVMLGLVTFVMRKRMTYLESL